jgi:hypothetical protein
MVTWVRTRPRNPFRRRGPSRRRVRLRGGDGGLEQINVSLVQQNFTIHCIETTKDLFTGQFLYHVPGIVWPPNLLNDVLNGNWERVRFSGVRFVLSKPLLCDLFNHAVS